MNELHAADGSSPDMIYCQFNCPTNNNCLAYDTGSCGTYCGNNTGSN